MSNAFHLRLREARELRELTQAELGRLAGLPSTTISHFESNTRKPSFDNLRRLSKALDVTTDYLMGLSEKPDASGAVSRIARHLSGATAGDIAVVEMLAEQMANKRTKGDG
jgi:transcriptional regulator with XRE-family HTH domain